MGQVVGREQELSQCDDGLPTASSDTQQETEEDCARFYLDWAGVSGATRASLQQAGLATEAGEPLLLRAKTVAYLRTGLERPLGASYTSLDASRPWLCYWMLHALTLLGEFPADLAPGVRATLRTCLCEGGAGFGGGFMQAGHTAPTYAAVLALCTLGDAEALGMLDRTAMYGFFMSLKDPATGGFHVQMDGEMDTRGLYTVIAVAAIMGILTPELTDKCADFVAACQTFEGGIGGEPGNEAHGGYAFCAVATLAILGRFDAIDVDALVTWLAAKQMRLEGGFQGRTNKLVDACYSFWQGAVPSILAEYLDVRAPDGSQVYDEARLQQYILLCCQQQEGGLRDKPSKRRDQYHTAYALSGLAVAQGTDGQALSGPKANLLNQIDPVFNVEAARLKRAREHFQAMPKFVPPPSL